ncbi:MAG: tetratricopeptide repeat protein, partial [Pseudomonadota bacterium]
LMSAYDLEEQERISALKDWWDKWGTWVYAALTTFFLGVAAAQGWKYYQKQQTIEAEALFLSVQKVAQESTATKEWKKLSDAATALAGKYPSTFYATDAQLMAAKAAFDIGEIVLAKKHLEWVVENGRESHKSIAKIRLAALMVDEKKFDDALKILDSVKDDGYLSMVADQKGDIYAAQGRRDEARASFELAVEKAEQRSPLKTISKAKLDAFGGATEKPVDKKVDDKKADDTKNDTGAKK